MIFRSTDDGYDPVLWSHELTHVLQYRRLGVEAFAAIYASPGFDALEQEARLFDQFVAQRLSQANNVQYWQTSTGWNQQITNQQWAAAAQNVINPLQCSGSNVETNRFGQMVLVQVNNCPIPIRVSQVKYNDPRSGAPVNFPCTKPNCFVPAMSRQEYQVLPGLVYAGMDIIWK